MAVYSLFADILDYPETRIDPLLNACVSETVDGCPEAAALLGSFQSALAGMSLGELQELYTATFDMRPDSTPSLGYHLFGDDVRRSFFMAKLKERLDARRVALGCELPDHLPLVLRLVECEGPGEESRILVTECLLPALSRMVQTLGQGAGEGSARNANVYRHALEALLVYLRKDASQLAPAEQKKESQPGY